MSAEPALDVEILTEAVEAAEVAEAAPERAPLEPGKVRRLCALAAASVGVHAGHLAIELVAAPRIRELNAAHRGRDAATDVLSFPIDGAAAIDAADAAARIDAQAIDGVPRELGDVVICPAHTADLYEAVVHGVLHLVGLDHERDDGEMLALQAEILRWETLAR